MWGKGELLAKIILFAGNADGTFSILCASFPFRQTYGSDKSRCGVKEGKGEERKRRAEEKEGKG